MYFPSDMNFQYFFFSTYIGDFLQMVPIALLTCVGFTIYRKRREPGCTLWSAGLASLFPAYLLSLVGLTLFSRMIKDTYYILFYHRMPWPEGEGGYLIQMLFKEPVAMPDKEKMTAAMEKHIGAVKCFCYDKKTAGFAALEHIAEFKDGKAPVQLMVMGCSKFKGKGFDTFLMSQMWDCQEDRERIFRECRYQVVAADMLAAALPALERANLDADFLEALAELYPTCEAFYFQNCGKLFLAEDVRSHQIEGPDRFIRFGVNVRFFNTKGTEDMLIDTLGMGTLFLPDLQYHFHGMDPNWVVNHAYNAASYILANDNPIQDGETVDGIVNGKMSREIQWKCRYEEALVQPARGVLDIHMGEFAAGQRQESTCN